MKKLTYILLIFLPCLLKAQHSFIQSTTSEYEIEEIMHLTQLSNGYYCVKTLESDITIPQSRIERLYLFDHCGRYVNHLEYLYNNPFEDDFYDFENIIEYDSKIFVTGAFSNGLVSTYYLQLDIYNLSLIGDIGYYGKKYLMNESKVFNNTLYQFSANDVDLGLSVLNKDMKRQKMLSKENWHPDFFYYKYQDATKNSVFSIIVDDHIGQHISISDYELNQTHLIKLKNDSIYRNYDQLVLLDDSTYICRFDEVVNNSTKSYISKYKMDEEILKRELFEDEPSFDNGIVRKIIDNTLHIFTFKGWHRTYDLEGNFIEQIKVIPDSVSSVSSAFLTSDSGIIAAYDYWEKIDNKWFVSVNLMKLNSDWKLSIQNDICYTSTLDIPERRINVSVFPNPTSGGFTIQCSNPFHRLIVYKNDVSVIIDKSYDELVNSDSIEIDDTGLFTIIVYDSKGNKISTRVLKI